jgi:hypothetical protein
VRIFLHIFGVEVLQFPMFGTVKISNILILKFLKKFKRHLNEIVQPKKAKIILNFGLFLKCKDCEF